MSLLGLYTFPRLGFSQLKLEFKNSFLSHISSKKGDILKMTLLTPLISYHYSYEQFLLRTVLYSVF
jgi:hypothetical protein